LTNRSMRNRLLATTIICGAAFAALPALAQDAKGDVEEIIVTGSRIPQTNLQITSPVTQISAKDLTVAGVTRVEDLVNQLPQAFAAQNATVSNGASGTATIALRNLGSVRTLVLIDGRRMGYGSPGDSAADINQIPGGLIDRVDILTGGSSAVYGSDALAGVVNFVMKKNFEGIRVDAQYSFYQHNNQYDGIGDLRNVIAGRAKTNPAQFQIPSDNVTDGYGKDITLMMGLSSPDRKGNITAYATYRNNDKVLQANRDYSACTLGGETAAGAFTCGGSSTSYPGRFTNFDTFNYTLDKTTGEFIPFVGSRDQYNFGPLNYYQRPDERYTLGAFGQYEINKHAEIFTQLMFADYSTVAQIAPSGDFGNTSTINCDNPLLSASQKTAIGCSAAMIASGATTDLTILRRNVEGGGRQDDRRFQSYRAVIGARGEIGQGWSYDTYAEYSRVQLSQVYRNDFSVSRLTKALDVVSVGGVPTCRSVVDGTDPACVPYNIFKIGGVTPAALAYVQIPLIRTGYTTLQVVSGSVSGDLGQYGFKSPLADTGVSLVLGAEIRRDTLGSEVDTAFATGDGAGQGGPTRGLSGSTSVYELFTESKIPLVSDKPLAKAISVDVAYRRSSYSGSIDTDTYKIGGDWAPTSDIRFRASYQQAIRAPNVIESYLPQGEGLFDLVADPCGTAKTATLAQCLATGVPAARYGSQALDNSANQYTLLQGGNTNLSPEESKTKTFGVVLTPSLIPNFDLTIDYFDIAVDNTISTFGAENAINACYVQNLAIGCSKIKRNAGGQLWTAGGYVEDTNTNIGGIKTTGFDVNANYRLNLEDQPIKVIQSLGSLNFNLTGTKLQKLETEPNPVIAKFDCAGYFGSICSSSNSITTAPSPKWRHRFRANWQTPWNADLSVTWRYYGKVDLYTGGEASTRIDRQFDAQNYIDLSGNWKVNDTASFRAGVNNVLDRDPPLNYSVGTTGNGNTYPQTYDALGRYVFVGVTLDF
jgi:iron complex outermembrane receptor protein